MPYKILITSGGTSEKIDDVRKITNASTGKLGSLIAQAFYNQDLHNEITYICSQNAVYPALPLVRVIPITDVASLQQTMTQLLQTEKWDAIIHAMAVSDYMLKTVTTAEILAKSIADIIIENKIEDLESRICEVITTQKTHAQSTKITSQHTNLTLIMQRTPKIIGMIKALQPRTILVGFKLLQHADESELIRAGHALLQNNNCDFVLANDLSSIEQGAHIGYLVKPDASYTISHTKEDIATAIASAVSLQLGL